MGRFGHMTRVPWVFWLTAALCAGYCVAIVMGVPVVQALLIVCVAAAADVFCVVPEEYVALRPRSYAVAGTVVLAGLAFVVTGGNVTAGVVTLTVALNVVAFAITVAGMKAHLASSRNGTSGTRA